MPKKDWHTELELEDFELSAWDNGEGVFVLCPWGIECPVENNTEILLKDAENIQQAIDWANSHKQKHEIFAG